MITRIVRAAGGNFRTYVFGGTQAVLTVRMVLYLRSRGPYVTFLQKTTETETESETETMPRWNPQWAAPARHPTRWEAIRRPPRSATTRATSVTFATVALEREPVMGGAEKLPDPAWAPSEGKAEFWRELYRQRARELWACSFSESLDRERYADPELWLSVAAHFAGQMSTYRARLTDQRITEQYDAKAQKQVRDAVAVLRRRRNAHIIPFSTAARSISYFNQRVPERVWRDQQRGLRIGALLPPRAIRLPPLSVIARWPFRTPPTHTSPYVAGCTCTLALQLHARQQRKCWTP